MMMVISFTILLSAFCILGLSFFNEYSPWNPYVIITEKHSKMVNLPRKKWEKLAVWEKRVNLATEELFDAEDAFLIASKKEGWITQHGPRALTFHLPPDHPASIRYAKAKGLIP